MHPYERWIIRRYLANALRSSRFVRPPSADRDIFPWIDNCSRLLDLPELAARTLSSRRRVAIEPPMYSARWVAWRAATIGIAREPAPNPSPLHKLSSSAERSALYSCSTTARRETTTLLRF